MLLEDTKRLLNNLNIRARKRLGQHFLVDEKALEQSLDAADITKEDTVIEVGSGLGVLTAELAERARRVIAVELDDNLAAMLKRRLS
ncbi:MAG: 16S rRNA (adenine(1518)-N(6)/adenine(1519)-N(6))-dimethyltransferase, partial [Chloroflexi bacterium]|nr:16S rRNA (adenine(1518)-N(6)/adenine(1519)-N(6))-dimethyltransferase [Chloroflexota bacterium]